jgi:hypothetical protein
LEYIPNALGCHIAGVSKFTWIILVHKTSSLGAGLSVEYI